MRVFHSTAISTNLLLMYKYSHISYSIRKILALPEHDTITLIRLIYDNTMSTVTKLWQNHRVNSHWHKPAVFKWIKQPRAQINLCLLCKSQSEFFYCWIQFSTVSRSTFLYLHYKITSSAFGLGIGWGTFWGTFDLSSLLVQCCTCLIWQLASVFQVITDLNPDWLENPIHRRHPSVSLLNFAVLCVLRKENSLQKKHETNKIRLGLFLISPKYTFYSNHFFLEWLDPKHEWLEMLLGQFPKKICSCSTVQRRRKFSKKILEKIQHFN